MCLRVWFFPQLHWQPPLLHSRFHPTVEFIVSSILVVDFIDHTWCYSDTEFVVVVELDPQ